MSKVRVGAHTYKGRSHKGIDNAHITWQINSQEGRGPKAQQCFSYTLYEMDSCIKLFTGKTVKISRYCG